MYKTILATILFLAFGCKQAKIKTRTNLDSIQPIIQKEYSDIFYNAYDITNLKLYTDTSKFIGRLVLNTHYGATTIIQMTDNKDYITLCVKQPFEELDGFDSINHLAFNQLCYNYRDSEAQTIKSQFLRYNTHKIISKTCGGCIYHIQCYVEIYDHGKYSFYRQDSSFVIADKIFFDNMLSKAHINSKNGLKINY